MCKMGSAQAGWETLATNWLKKYQTEKITPERMIGVIGWHEGPRRTILPKIENSGRVFPNSLASHDDVSTNFGYRLERFGL